MPYVPCAQNAESARSPPPLGECESKRSRRETQSSLVSKRLTESQRVLRTSSYSLSLQRDIRWIPAHLKMQNPRPAALNPERVYMRLRQELQRCWLGYGPKSFATRSKFRTNFT